MADTLKFKIKKPSGEVKSTPVERTEPVKSLKNYDEYDGQELSVLGIPFGGPLMGRDSDGEAFHKDTDIMLNVGDTRPVTYYHGYGPDDPYEWQEQPAVIGLARLAKMDKRGWWFDVKLDANEPLARRIDPQKSKASSGAVGHLVRMGKAGMIDTWPIGELALFDTNEWRQPANDYAVVEAKKSDTQEVEAKTDEVKAEATQVEFSNIKTNKELNKMDKETEIKEAEQKPVAPEIDYVKMADAMKPVVVEAVAAKFDELKNEEPTIKGAPVILKETKPGFSAEPTAAFMHYIKTGRTNSMLKTDLQEGDDTEGGYLVPDDFVPKIFAKMNELSVAKRAGALVIPTSLDVVKIPIEGTQASVSLTNEEGTYGTSTLEFDQVSVTIYKNTVQVNLSEELLADNKTNLESWLMPYVGERMAVKENSYTIAGTGSSQPQGVLYGGTAGLTFNGTNTIAVGEIPELLYKLKEQYIPGAAWVMQSATYGFLQGLTGNQFQLFQPAVGPSDAMALWNHPVFFSASMEAYSTTGKKSLVIGDWSKYALCEREGISVLRNPYLYANSGKVALHFKRRWGGAVIQAEAFQYGTQA